MKFLLISLFTFFIVADNNQPETSYNSPDTIKWYSFNDAVELSKTNKKTIMVDIYTDWCAPCKKMDKYVFTNPAIAEYINANFYPVKLDGESKKQIHFKGKNYKFSKKEGIGVHDLVWELISDKNRLEFPSFVFLDENQNFIKQVYGYHEVEKFKSVLKNVKTNN